MRWTAVIALLAAGCSGSAPLPEAVHPATAPPTDVAAPEPLPPAAIRIEEEQIVLDGVVVGSAGAIREHGRPIRVQELFARLDARREAWLEEHPSATFLGEASLVVDPATPAVVLTSVLLSLAAAGHPVVTFLADDQEVTLRLARHAPPCEDCSPEGLGYRAYLAIDDRGTYRLLVPREGDRLEYQGTDPAALGVALRAVHAATNVHALVLHLPPDASVGSLEPHLRAVIEAQRAAGDHALGLSTAPVEPVPMRALAATLPTPGSASLPPDEIQRLVRQKFGAFQRCYNLALTRDRSARGRVMIEFAIAWDGSVYAVDVAVQKTLPASIGDCLARVVWTLRFPPPTVGILTVSYPIVFTR